MPFTHTHPSPLNIIPCNPPSRSLFRHFSVLEKYALGMFNFLKWYCDFRRKNLAVSYFFFLSVHYFWTLLPDVYKPGLSLGMTRQPSARGVCDTFLTRYPLGGPLGLLNHREFTTSLQGLSDPFWKSSPCPFSPAMLGSEVPTSPDGIFSNFCTSTLVQNGISLF